jgi:hypothetical protein
MWRISYCVGDRCDMTENDENRGRSRRPDPKDRKWLSIGRILGDQTIEISGDVMCSLHRARGDEERNFLVEPQNQCHQVSRYGS